MSAPLTTRETLAEALKDAGLWMGAEIGGELHRLRIADALLASGALIDATKLAEDEALVERVYEGQWDVDVSTVRWWGGRRDVVRLLKATAAALSAQSERAEVEAVNVDRMRRYAAGAREDAERQDRAARLAAMTPEHRQTHLAGRPCGECIAAGFRTFSGAMLRARVTVEPR